MNNLRTVLRILRVAWRYRLQNLIPADRIRARMPRAAVKLLQTRPKPPGMPDGERLREALIELGPVYIKFGQLLSTRRDLLPLDIADALAGLQDNVGPIPDFDVHTFVKDCLQAPWQDVFTSIESTPLASASIAQVHRGQLRDGTQVVVKIVRPDISDKIEHDMQLLAAGARWLEQRFPELKRLCLPAIVRDHHAVLVDELDMFKEARNQIQLRRNFAESELLYVPRVYGELTRSNLLVMEFVDGVPISQVQVLREHGVDLQQLAYKGVQTFFTQVFEHNFFHADMHPGNILIDLKDPENARYIALDCAIIGSLDERDQLYLARNLEAFFNRDYARVAALFSESGWIPADTDLDEFERVIRQVCDPIFARPLAEISFGDFVVELFRAAGQFQMHMQPQLALLQKTLLYIEGLGRTLYPQLDLWETAKPFIERWVAERINPLSSFMDWFSAWLANPTGPQQREQQLTRHLQQQTTLLKEVEAQLMDQRRRRSTRRYAGVGLLVLSTVLLWQPLGELVLSGQSSTLAGLIGAVWGTALIMRA